jgi:hypothetical protein
MAHRKARSALPRDSHAPVHYTTALSETILEQLAKGRTLRDVCDDHGMPSRQTVQRWATDNIGGFAARYRRAWYVGVARQTLEIANEAFEAAMQREAQGDGAKYPPGSEHVIRSLLRIEARCWMLVNFSPDGVGGWMNADTKCNASARCSSPRPPR